MKSKKLLLTLLSFVAAVGMLFAFAACDKTPDSGKEENPPITDGGEDGNKEHRNSLYI